MNEDKQKELDELLTNFERYLYCIVRHAVIPGACNGDDVITARKKFIGNVVKLVDGE